MKLNILKKIIIVCSIIFVIIMILGISKSSSKYLSKKMIIDEVSTANFLVYLWTNANENLTIDCSNANSDYNGIYRFFVQNYENQETCEVSTKYLIEVKLPEGTDEK